MDFPSLQRRGLGGGFPDGTGTAFWNPDKTGDYRIDYRAKDKYGNDITASESITVYTGRTTTPACKRPTSALPCSGEEIVRAGRYRPRPRDRPDCG